MVAARMVEKYGVTEAAARVRARALRSVDSGRVSLQPKLLDRYILWSFVGTSILRRALGWSRA